MTCICGTETDADIHLAIGFEGRRHLNATRVHGLEP